MNIKIWKVDDEIGTFIVRIDDMLYEMNENYLPNGINHVYQEYDVNARKWIKTNKLLKSVNKISIGLMKNIIKRL